MIRTSSMRRALGSHHSGPHHSGFTLIELLVATTVFIIGFTAAFGLFLAAMRFRTLTDDTVKLSLAASSLVAELGIGSVPGPNAKLPSEYLGSGDLPGSTGTDIAKFYLNPGVPGSWYVVESCTDVAGQDGAETPTLHLNLLVVMYPQGDPAQPLDINDLNRRMRLITPLPTPPWDAATTRQAYDELVKRGLAMRITAVVVRRPHWM